MDFNREKKTVGNLPRKRFIYPAQNEKGIVLPISMMMITILILMGGTALKMASTEILVARPVPYRRDPSARSASIVLTTRDERDNIEPMVRAIPQVGSATEIIFVEGHSRDGTREEIERVIKAYPHKGIRLLVQDGVG